MTRVDSLARWSAHIRTVPAATIAAVAAVAQVGSSEHEEAGIRIEISQLAGLHGIGVTGEDLGPSRMTSVQSLRVGLGEWSIRQLVHAHGVMIKAEPPALSGKLPMELTSPEPSPVSCTAHWGAMRILSLHPSATEIVYALGLEDQLVGVTHECDWPPDARRKPAASVSALPSAASPAEIDHLVSASIGDGEPIYRLDEVVVRDLQPDIVLSQDLCAVCAVPSGHVDAALRVLGCSAEVVSLDPDSLDEVLDCVLRVGTVTGTLSRAEELGLRAPKAARTGETGCGRSSTPAHFCPRMVGPALQRRSLGPGHDRRRRR